MRAQNKASLPNPGHLSFQNFSTNLHFELFPPQKPHRSRFTPDSMPLSQPTTCMCFEKMGESTRQIQSSGKQAEAGLPSFEANHRRAFLLELIRYFWAKKQCSFASQAFQIITAAIAIKGCSPALLNLYVYDCKVNVCVVRSALKICFQPIFLADQISCSFL